MKGNLKKLFLFALIILVVFSLVLSSCKKKEAEKPEAEQPIKVGMATDVGGLGDKSFNDGAYNGILLGRDRLGVVPTVIESKQQTDYVPNLSGLAEDGHKLVFAVGFLMADALIEAAQNNPDAFFAGIDIGVDTATAPKNVQGILYKEEESGYLAGVLAGLMTKEYAHVSPRLNDRNVVGAVLGMFIPPVERFEVGFYQGVKSVNPDCEVISVVTGSFTDQAKGKEAALAMIERGADIIFQIAGLTGLGAINAAQERGVCAIGVDVDQNAVAPDTVMTSAVKGIVNSTFHSIQSVVDGTFVGGTNKVYGINEDSTGIAPFHSFESVIPQEVKDILNKTIADMKAGKIKIATTRAEAGMK